MTMHESMGEALQSARQSSSCIASVKSWITSRFGRRHSSVVVSSKERDGAAPNPEAGTLRQTQSAVRQDPDGYVLKRDYMGSCRLNLQHYLWRDTLKFVIHPDIPIASIGCEPRIADVATGKLDGLDIDLAQAPHHGWLPDRIRLRQWDMFSEVPEDLVGVYDIVHVRLVMLVIKDNNPGPLINNLRKLLKPGGYLQWDEVDQESKTIVKAHDDAQSHAIRTMFRLDIVEGTKGSDEWQTTLAPLLNRNGFRNAKEHRYYSPPRLARYWNDMYLLSWHEFLTRTMGDSPKAAAAVAVADKGMEEAQKGAGIAMPITIWTAQAT